MIESHMEQHPLLENDYSDEEICCHTANKFNSYEQNSFRSLGQAKFKLKGAAAIIKTWPDHWASSLPYWWIGLGMISIAIFIIYNSALVMTSVPYTNKQTRLKSAVSYLEKPYNETSNPEVFIHFFENDNQEIDLYEFIKISEPITSHYKDFKFNLIVIFNDTLVRHGDLMSAEETNDIALNSLWRDSNIKRENINSNVFIKHIMLSKYMNTTPLWKNWKYLPEDHLRFLIRALAIWEKGGIAFNPNILTNHMSNKKYHQNLENIFYKYAQSRKVRNKIVVNENKMSRKTKVSTQVNNIQDIIEALEKEDKIESPEIILSEAEGRNSLVRIESNYKIDSIPLKENTTIIKKNYTVKPNSGTSPKFIDYLFHGNNKNKFQTEDKRNDSDVIDKSSQVSKKNIVGILSSRNIDTNEHGCEIKRDDVPKSIISAKLTSDKSRRFYKPKKYNQIQDMNSLFIDIKGKIIATTTECHAFIGNMITNAARHSNEETIKDFIVSEISSFCNGLMFCEGIKLLL